MRLAVTLLTSVIATGCVLDFDELALGPGGGNVGATISAGPITGSGAGGSTSVNVGGGTLTSTGGGGSTGSGFPSCGMGGLCVPPAPDGWFGPILLRAGSTCDTEETDLPLATNTITATGSCGCAKVSSTTCSAPVVVFGNGSCADSTVTTAVTPGLTCAPVGAAKSATSAGPAPAPTGVPCSPTAIPPLVFEDPYVSCKSDEVPCGVDGACIEPDAQDSICIRASGSVSCPDDTYVTELHFVTATETCTCGTASFNCGGQTKVGDYAAGCTQNVSTIQTDQVCVNLGTSAAGALFVPDNASLFAGQCADMGPTLAKKSVTVCCIGH